VLKRERLLVPVLATLQGANMGTRLSVPFIGQIEESGSGFNNCGPAAGAMLAAYNGKIEATREAMHHFSDRMRDGVLNGNWDAGVYTDYPQIIMELGRYDLPCKRITDWDGVFATIDAGQPVILWLLNDLLQPRQYPAGGGWSARHFIVLTGYDDENFYVNDPLSYPARAPGYYTGHSVRGAVAALGQVYAMAVDVPPPGGPVVPEPDPNKPPPPWDGLWDEINRQNEALREEIASLKSTLSERDLKIEGLNGDVAAIQSDRDYNANKSLAFEAWIRSKEGKRVQVKRGLADQIIASVPR